MLRPESPSHTDNESAPIADDPRQSPSGSPFQFSLRWLFGLTATVALALWTQTMWGWLAGLITMGVVGFVVRYGRPLNSASEVGSAAGALAGFLLVAIHGNAIEAAIYQRDMVPCNVGIGAAMFTAAGLIVGLKQDRGRLAVRYAVNWGAAGSILGGAIGILTAIIAGTPALGPTAALLFAVFVSSYTGGLLAHMPIREN